jgi:hypothetical protein
MTPLQPLGSALDDVVLGKARCQDERTWCQVIYEELKQRFEGQGKVKTDPIA